MSMPGQISTFDDTADGQAIYVRNRIGIPLRIAKTDTPALAVTDPMRVASR